MTRPAVLVVTRNYPPLTGGMERLLQHAVIALAREFDVTVIGPAGGEAACPDDVRYLGCPARAALFLPCALLKGLAVCRRRGPDLILGGSGLVAPITAALARICRAASGLLVHGLDLVAENAVYQALFVPAVRRHDRVIANSAHTQRLALAHGCAPPQVCTLNPGVSVPDAEELAHTSGFAAEHGLAGKRVVLFVGRMIERKGLTPFIRRAWPAIRRGLGDAVLLVVGDSPDDALKRDADYGRRLEAAVGSATTGSILFLGGVDDDTLRAAYARADCLVFPLVAVRGDVEGFGMVALEAAACGTPTVAFDVGGVADAVDAEASGRLVAAGDYEEFARQVVRLARGDGPTASQCRAFASRFAWPQYGDGLIASLRELIVRRQDGVSGN